MKTATNATRRGEQNPGRRYTLARVTLARVHIGVEVRLGYANGQGTASAEREAFGALTEGGFHIETYSGAYVDISAPDPSDIRLADVAHGLAHTCRGAGQTARFYSVAEHAVLVSRRLREIGCPLRIVLAGLHHDDPEAYLHDVTKPLKHLLTPYGELEAEMWEAIRVGLHLGACDIEHAAVKAADTWALGAENHHLRRSHGRTWYCADVYSPLTHPLNLGLAPPDAEAVWLREHSRLRDELTARCC
jgi:hypothetical protein